MASLNNLHPLLSASVLPLPHPTGAVRKQLTEETPEKLIERDRAESAGLQSI